MIPTTTITAVILAGGIGRRMGGQDKGLVELDGRPLIEHIIDALKPQVMTILINANRNQYRYASYGYPVITDTLANYQGPLAGFAAGLAAAD
ncbi:MAG TPA: molybdenum cofactor guanylyltransferase MobA, partial [Chromatiales bacterium]|nr:molybdenum cofactor guanylyltransferase MobA [Chromatiales bacterium]